MVNLGSQKRDNKFYALLQQATANIVKMAKELKELIHVWDYTTERVTILTDLEQDGDAITHEIMKLCYRNFITPLDREDIGAIARAIDDVADSIHAAADVLLLYKVELPTEKAKELTSVIERVAIEVEGGIASLFGRINHDELLKRTKEINHLENLGDEIYRAAVAGLLESDNEDLYVVKWRKVYELMESAIDDCEFVADVLEGVSMKYA